MLQSDGKVSANFTWVDASRAEDPGGLLKAEGLSFHSQGRAEPERRFATDQLALLIGAEIQDRTPEIPPGQNPQLRDRFHAQLLDRQGPDITRAVAEVINAWADLGWSSGVRDRGGDFVLPHVAGQIRTRRQHLARRRLPERQV